MDSKKDSRRLDESRERLHEEALALRMAEALDRISGEEAKECLGADIIAAYHERSLAPEETALCEGHFAACARCRKIMAVLAASQDEPLAENEVARLGELVAGTMRSPGNTKPQEIKSIRPGGWDWRVRWLAPALGIAAVLTIWFAERPPWRASSQESSGTLVAQAPKNEVPPSLQPEEPDQLSRSMPQRDEKSSVPSTVPMSRGRSDTDRPVPVTPENPPAERSSDGSSTAGRSSSSGDIAANSLRKENKLQNLPDGNVAPAPIPPIAKTEAEAAQAMSTPQSGKDSDGNGRAELREKVAPAPERAPGIMVAPQSSARAASSQPNIQSFSALKSPAGLSVLIKAPSGSTIWRAGTNGMIELSTDAGHTYSEQTSPSREDWLAGAAVSDTVGWLVGRDGTIARTMDAEHWERVPPPSQLSDSLAKLPDWVGVTAHDAQDATIATRDGRRFATQDGGKTWQPQ